MTLPLIQDRPEIRMLGLRAGITEDTRARIPALWTELTRRYPEIEDVALDGGYGVSLAPGQSGVAFDYVAALPVPRGAPVPKGFVAHCLVPGRYAIFPHGGMTDDLARHCDEIFAVWIRSGRLALRPGAVHLVECYLPGFDPTRPGQIELWLPLE
jgi:predicted transcriptional regulator YdeE